VFWIPEFLKTARGLDDVQAGVFASLPLWGGAVGGTLGGVLNDWLIHRTGSRRWGRATVALTGKFLAGVFMALSIGFTDGRGAMVVLLFCKFFGDWSMSTQWGTITDISGRGAGTVFGIVNGVGAVAACVAGPMIGYLIEEFGWTGLFWTMAGMYLAASLCWLFIDCTRPVVIEDDTKEASP
jgi:nitrate/nitrite transporter NarK